jgi:L-2,4-diaminobutyrate decarboxylase
VGHRLSGSAIATTPSADARRGGRESIAPTDQTREGRLPVSMARLHAEAGREPHVVINSEEDDGSWLSDYNASQHVEFLTDVLRMGLRFRERRAPGMATPLSNKELAERYLTTIPEEGCDYETLTALIDDLLSHSFNFASPHFLGFPDAGDSVAAIAGGLVEVLAQQNLLNASFCAKAATFVEIATIDWLRGLAGFPVRRDKASVRDIGGVAVVGGSVANTFGLLMARKRAFPNAIRAGVDPGQKARVVMPSDVTHYSLVGAVSTIGLGTDAVLRVPTKNFRYDQGALQTRLRNAVASGEKPICVVINAGDSRTLSVDDIAGVIEVARAIAPDIWVHVDACHGGQLLFSKRHRHKLAGLELADSMSIDPHKVLAVPYTLSYFLVRDPREFDGFWTSSSLIMGDPWSLGQLTPSLGSKSWSSLKLYLHMQKAGRSGIERLINRRLATARRFYNLIRNNDHFRCFVPSLDINSVPFLFLGPDGDKNSPQFISALNESIYKEMLKSGNYYLHGFTINDDCNMLNHGGAHQYFVLRWMSGNANVTDAVMAGTMAEVERMGMGLLGGSIE